MNAAGTTQGAKAPSSAGSAVREATGMGAVK